MVRLLRRISKDQPPKQPKKPNSSPHPRRRSGSLPKQHKQDIVFDPKPKMDRVASNKNNSGIARERKLSNERITSSKMGKYFQSPFFASQPPHHVPATKTGNSNKQRRHTHSEKPLREENKAAPGANKDGAKDRSPRKGTKKTRSKSNRENVRKALKKVPSTIVFDDSNFEFLTEDEYGPSKVVTALTKKPSVDFIRKLAAYSSDSDDLPNSSEERKDQPMSDLSSQRSKKLSDLSDLSSMRSKRRSDFNSSLVMDELGIGFEDALTGMPGTKKRSSKKKTLGESLATISSIRPNEAIVFQDIASRHSDCTTEPSTLCHSDVKSISKSTVTRKSSKSDRKLPTTTETPVKSDAASLATKVSAKSAGSKLSNGESRKAYYHDILNGSPGPLRTATPRKRRGRSSTNKSRTLAEFISADNDKGGKKAQAVGGKAGADSKSIRSSPAPLTSSKIRDTPKGSSRRGRSRSNSKTRSLSKLSSDPGGVRSELVAPFTVKDFDLSSEFQVSKSGMVTETSKSKTIGKSVTDGKEKKALTTHSGVDPKSDPVSTRTSKKSDPQDPTSTRSSKSLGKFLSQGNESAVRRSYTVAGNVSVAETKSDLASEFHVNKSVVTEMRQTVKTKAKKKKKAKKALQEKKSSFFREWDEFKEGPVQPSKMTKQQRRKKRSVVLVNPQLSESRRLQSISELQNKWNRYKGEDGTSRSSEISKNSALQAELKGIRDILQSRRDAKKLSTVSIDSQWEPTEFSLWDLELDSASEWETDDCDDGRGGSNELKNPRTQGRGVRMTVPSSNERGLGLNSNQTLKNLKKKKKLKAHSMPRKSASRM